jgi:hypothetical protein
MMGICECGGLLKPCFDGEEIIGWECELCHNFFGC